MAKFIANDNGSASTKLFPFFATKSFHPHMSLDFEVEGFRYFWKDRNYLEVSMKSPSSNTRKSVKASRQILEEYHIHCWR